jgi:hypothetical protein
MFSMALRIWRKFVDLLSFCSSYFTFMYEHKCLNMKAITIVSQRCLKMPGLAFFHYRENVLG